MALSEITHDLVLQLQKWKKAGNAAMFEIECKDHESAVSLRNDIKQHGFNGFTQRFGKWVGIVYYLTDHKS